jgi:AcrR family transcriptional regulator
MSDREKRPVVSRRSRPAKAPLSQEAIVSAALEILERDGIDGLSLRRVAGALDTGAASLYVYIKGISELYALMLDRTLGAVRLPEEPGLSWRDRLKAVLGSYHQALVGRRGMAQLAMSVVSTGPNALRLGEDLIGLLKQGGAGDVEAALGVDLLTMHVTAVVAEKSNWQANGESVGRVRDALLAIRPEEFPNMVAARDAFLSGDPLDRLNWAIDVIIDGIVGGRTLTPRPRASRARRSAPS